VAEKRCRNGHLIDVSWDLCPYCPPEPAEVSIVRPRGADDSRSRSWVAQSPLPPTEVPADPPPIRRTSPQAEAAPVSRTIAVPKADLGIGTAPRLVVGWLVGLTGAIRGESFAIRTGKTTLGRDPRSDIVLFDDQTSSHHADLVYRPEEKRFILMDANSTNGTFVNDVEIEPRKNLAHHDVISIGKQKFLFVQFDADWDDPRWAR
jgi:pSer/pThr/pTyr-binding forkhead associated (FHA) protein